MARMAKAKRLINNPLPIKDAMNVAGVTGELLHLYQTTRRFFGEKVTVTAAELEESVDSTQGSLFSEEYASKGDKPYSSRGHRRSR